MLGGKRVCQTMAARDLLPSMRGLTTACFLAVAWRLALASILLPTLDLPALGSNVPGELVTAPSEAHNASLSRLSLPGFSLPRLAMGTEQLRMQLHLQAELLDACPAWDSSDAPFLDDLDGTLLPVSGESCRDISHLELIFADIDADNDLDVIVVNLLSAEAESVWRNDGKESLTRLADNRFGATPFRHNRMGHNASRRPDISLLLGMGASLSQITLGVSPCLPVLHAAMVRSTPAPVRFSWLTSPGRAPPIL
jgi:hypothetical protein